MKTITRTVYDFDELADQAKDRARDWYRQCQDQDQDWADAVIDDFSTIARLLGITLATQAVPLMNGKTRQEPQVYYALHVQGAGACFGGTYAYRKGCLKAIREYAPQDEELHRIAGGLTNLQRCYGYSLTARITTGREIYPEATTIETFNERDREIQPEHELPFRELLRDLMRWLYRTLDAEWSYQTSDEAIDEVIRINEYTFDEQGRRDG